MMTDTTLTSWDINREEVRADADAKVSVSAKAKETTADAKVSVSAKAKETTRVMA